MIKDLTPVIMDMELESVIELIFIIFEICSPETMNAI